MVFSELGGGVGWTRATSTIGRCDGHEPRGRGSAAGATQGSPPWRKLELVCDLNRALRQLVLSELAQSYPDKSESELRVLLAERLYGTEVAEVFQKALLA